MSKPRIAIVTAVWGQPAYFAYAAAINRAYCERHGYDWRPVRFDRDALPKDRSTHWAKVTALADVMREGYDFVLSLDGDAWVYDPTLTVEGQLVSRLRPSDAVLIGTDRRDANFAWNDGGVNVGSMLVRNSPIGRQIVSEWWHVPYYDKSTAHDWPPEQSAFNGHIRSRWHHFVNVVPYHVLNGRDGEFVRHEVGMPPAARVATIRGACVAQGLIGAGTMEPPFADVYARGGWGNGSGVGSSPDATVGYRDFLQRFMRERGVRSVLDVGCGDWQFSRLIDWTGIDYDGWDVVPDVVTHATSGYARPGVRFSLRDARLVPLPPADLIVLKDVLQHWPTADVLAFLPKLKGRTALVTNSVWPAHDLNADVPVAGFRPLDLRLPPFSVAAEQAYAYASIPPHGDAKVVLLLKG